MSRQVVPTAMLANLGVTSPKVASDLNVTHLGVNTTPASNDSLYVLGGPALVGGTQCGIEIGTTFGAQATAAGRAVECYVQTAAASFTMGQGAAIYADVPNLGAGSAITNQYGLYIANQGKAGITNAYGIYIAVLSGASGNQWGIWNASATRLANYTQIDGSVYCASSGQFYGNFSVGPQATTTNYAIYVNSTALATANQYGVLSTCVFTSAATGLGIGVEATGATPATSFTMGEFRCFSAYGPTVGSGSTITNAMGLRAQNMGRAGVTNAYGVYIDAQSGASAANWGLYNTGSTYLGGTTTITDFRLTYNVIANGATIPGWSSFNITNVPNCTVYLPNGSGRAGSFVVVKHWGSGTATVTPTGGQVIGMPDGTAPSSVVLNNGDSYMFISDGGAGMMVAAMAL